MPAARAIVGWIVADHGDAAAPPSPLTFTAEVAEEGKTLTGEISEVANSLAISAAKAKGMGNIYVGATLFIGGLILFLFLFFTQITSQPQINREQELRNQLYTLQASLPKASSDPEREIIMGEIKVTENQMEALTSTLTRSSDLLATALSNISSAIIRIGAVLVGIFLIQLMVGFVRYYYRLANHLLITSAMVRLSAGNILALKEIAPLLLPTGIDFGKMPVSPVERVLDGAFGAIQELSKKIPTR
jgi:hypothetical protein